MRGRGASLAGLALAAALAVPHPVEALQAVDDFGANPGALDLFVHAPSSLGADGAMVVALHGCTQSAADFDDETGLAALAEAVPFVLLLPQQRAANNAERCFNFFERGDNRPAEGESASIRNMIAYGVERFAVDPARIHVLGLSAGGSMTAVLMANYPELFRAGAVVAGTPFDCNRPTLLTSAPWWWLRTFFGEAAAASFACGILGPNAIDRTARDWGDAVRALHPTPPARWPRVSLWHGDADEVVDPANQRELLQQWSDVHGIDTAPESREVVSDAARERHADAAGTTLIESWTLADFPHALAVDPDAEPVACGVAAEFLEPAELCTVRRVAAFWGLAP
ncbi:MAG: PHB depolymerase family esterase [Alphaproteobacteria bacterium]|nr:PHB depolymerase family esterase [Alphaproteobacteria bacterium]